MQCEKCGFLNRKGVKFCEECGTELAMSPDFLCSHCGFGNRPAVKFCEECGKPLAKEAAFETNKCSNCGFQNRPDVRFCEECANPLTGLPAHRSSKEWTTPPAQQIPLEQPISVQVEKTKTRKRTWIWAFFGGLFIVFAILFVYVFSPSFLTMRISLNNESSQIESVPVAVDNEQVAESSDEAPPVEKESPAQEESDQVPMLAEVPVSVEEETNCNRSKYVRETIPDNTVFQPGEQFQKTWTVRNEGECTWNTEYTFEHTQGAYLNAETNINMPKVVKPGDEVTLSLDMQAPDEPGTYIGRWEIFSDDDEVLGWYSVVIDVIDDSVPEIFSVTSVNLFLDSNTEFSCTSACADISASGTGMVTYKWEDTFIGEAIESDATYFDTAGTKTVCSTCFAPGGFDVSFYVENPNNQNFGTISIPLTF